MADGQKARQDAARRQHQDPPRQCPRCASHNTKFCYFNNYSTKQPRHFCRDCERYWTHGGVMRNIPVGSSNMKKRGKGAAVAAASVTTVPAITVQPNPATFVSGVFRSGAGNSIRGVPLSPVLFSGGNMSGYGALLAGGGGLTFPTGTMGSLGMRREPFPPQNPQMLPYRALAVPNQVQGHGVGGLRPVLQGPSVSVGALTPVTSTFMMGSELISEHNGSGIFFQNFPAMSSNVFSPSVSSIQMTASAGAFVPVAPYNPLASPGVTSPVSADDSVAANPFDLAATMESLQNAINGTADAIGDVAPPAGLEGLVLEDGSEAAFGNDGLPSMALDAGDADSVVHASAEVSCNEEATPIKPEDPTSP